MALLDALDQSVFTRATHAHVGVIWLEIGEPDRCIEQLRAAGAPELAMIEPGRRGWLYTVLARAELEGGDRAAAAEWVARAEETVRGLELPLAEAWVLHARALLALADGDPAEAAALALLAAERAEAVQSPVPAARCRTLAGVALAQAGDSEQAVRLLTGAQRALAACEANRHRDEAARQLRRLGQRVSARQRRFGEGPGLGRAQRARARDRRPRGAGRHQPGDRRRAVPLPEDGRGASHQRVREARRVVALGGGRGGRPLSHHAVLTTLQPLREHAGSPQYMTPSRRNTVLIPSPAAVPPPPPSPTPAPRSSRAVKSAA